MLPPYYILKILLSPFLHLYAVLLYTSTTIHLASPLLVGIALFSFWYYKHMLNILPIRKNS